MKNLIQQIFAIDNNDDLNEVIEAVKIQQQGLRDIAIAKAKVKFHVGDKVAYNGKNGYTVGKIVKMKIKRADVLVNGTTWNVPLSMLEVA